MDLPRTGTGATPAPRRSPRTGESSAATAAIVAVVFVGVLSAVLLSRLTGAGRLLDTTRVLEYAGIGPRATAPARQPGSGERQVGSRAAPADAGAATATLPALGPRAATATPVVIVPVTAPPTVVEATPTTPPSPPRATAPASTPAAPAAAPATAVPSPTATAAPAATTDTRPSATITQPVKRYTVERGDTLYSLARRFNTSVDALVAANDLGSAEAILPTGRTLVIP